ncbi:MAG TPA: phospho-sugar mutase [Streptosporangiaceae bacterium]|jgi:phosphomannomutase|nr:phospho-sugar mutase [Streptosporangiaceae bacterium]
MLADDLRERAEAWMAADPDERDRAELASLLADPSPEAAAELEDRFARRLQFGTAGLRGAVGAGPGRMNVATVIATTAALARWLLDRDPAAAEAGVVIGHDARHRSDEFSLQAARVLAGTGIRVHLLTGRLPTPFLAFSVRKLSAAAGIMITASHNPREDNGYKLYLGDGAQIVPPADTEIESAISEVGPLGQIPLAAADSELISTPGDELTRSYLDAICALAPAPASAAWLRFVYTPLHGVAGRLALRAFEQAGFSAPDVVAAQMEPDPEFPTVRFPNPEEPGTLDLALAQARRSGADLIIANDPDGDRLAVGVPDADVPGGWRILTGDQVGALLGAFLLGRLTADPQTSVSDQLFVSTIVSGTLLSKIVAAGGAQYAQTLTGFKWIVRAADLREGVRFAFGYEEALGYSVGDVVRDKDGISAALAILSLAAVARSVGESLLDAYNGLEITHGVHLTEQLSMQSTTTMEVMARLRAAAPTELAGQPVTGITDYTGGSFQLPSADVLSYQLPGARVVIRPSGTEPKIKAYLEVVEPVRNGQLTAARQAGAERLERLRAAAEQLLT